MTRIVRLTLQYAGTAYAGWQIQPRLPTVQGTVEGALAALLPAERARLYAAGRTDAGVHARGQVAHFRTESALAPGAIQTALNRLLPWDVRVLDARDAPETFHARKSALAKEYRYRIFRGQVVPPEIHPYALGWSAPLDLPAMRAGAARLIGRHDFAGMRALGSTARTTVRTVAVSEWIEEGEALVYRIEADGFLYKMVRTIVGTLLEVGRGRRAADDLEDLLLRPGEGRAGPVAPARGLSLWSVRYPDGPGDHATMKPL